MTRGAALFLAALFFVLAGLGQVARAADPAACFSIQVGTFAVPDNALDYHARLRKALPAAVADQLRLERIGSLHVLRIGRAATREDLDSLLETVRAVADNPRVLAVDFRPERFLIPPRNAGLIGSAAPAAAPAREYAVQAACYTEPDAAEKAFSELRAALPPAAADLLRLEANGNLYVLRLGRAASPEELASLAEAVRAAGEAPEVLAAAYRPERFLIPPRSGAPVAVPASASPAGQGSPAPATAPAGVGPGVSVPDVQPPSVSGGSAAPVAPTAPRLPATSGSPASEGPSPAAPAAPVASSAPERPPVNKKPAPTRPAQDVQSPAAPASRAAAASAFPAAPAAAGQSAPAASASVAPAAALAAAQERKQPLDAAGAGAKDSAQSRAFAPPAAGSDAPVAALAAALAHNKTLAASDTAPESPARPPVAAPPAGGTAAPILALAAAQAQKKSLADEAAPEPPNRSRPSPPAAAVSSAAGTAAPSAAPQAVVEALPVTQEQKTAPTAKAAPERPEQTPAAPAAAEAVAPVAVGGVIPSAKLQAAAAVPPAGQEQKIASVAEAAPEPPAQAEAAAAGAAGGGRTVEFAVQAACYSEPDAAEKAFYELRNALPATAADLLRLEANGNLYVLRLGRAAAREELEPLLAAVRAAGETPEIMTVAYRPERFLIPPRSGQAASPQPAPTAAVVAASPAGPGSLSAELSGSASLPHGSSPDIQSSAVPEGNAAPASSAPTAPTALAPASPAAPPAAGSVSAAAGQSTPAGPAPAPSAPAERLPEVVATGYSVQLGSYASRANGLAMHVRLLDALPPDLADQLRLERVGIYYVLRLGLARTREEMVPVQERVAAYSPLPVVLAADLDLDRLVIPPRNLSRETSAAPETAPAPALAPAALAPDAVAPDAVAGEAAAPAPEEPLAPLPAFGATERERELMQARMATRTGRFPQGKKLYEKLLAEHPGDEEILEQYVDALVDAMEYDLARQLLADWMKREPDNPRPLRLTGLLFVRAGEYERSYAAFEDLLTRDPGDIGVMADLGYAKLGGRDWRRALELFSAVADEQPDNEAATQIVQEILMAHRPRLSSELRAELRADDALIATQANDFSAPLSDLWRLDLRYDLVRVERPSKDTQEAIDHTIQDWMLTARTVLHEDLDAFLGLGAVDGVGDRLSQQAGLEWQAHRTGRVLFLVERNRPWLDRVDATRYEGFQDHASLAYDALFQDRWGVYLAAERFRYAILDEEYGRRNLGTIRLTRRLGWRPNLWLGYAYAFGSAEYAEGGPRIDQGGALVLPVTLDDYEESHSLFMTLDERACRNVRLLLSGGGGQNAISGNAFFFGSAEVLVEVSNRLTVRLGAGHNSDKSSVGGETTTYTLGILWIF